MICEGSFDTDALVRIQFPHALDQSLPVAQRAPPFSSWPLRGVLGLARPRLCPRHFSVHLDPSSSTPSVQPYLIVYSSSLRGKIAGQLDFLEFLNGKKKLTNKKTSTNLKEILTTTEFLGFWGEIRGTKLY